MKHYEDITFTIVVWNDAERLRKLLEHVRPWFKTLAVVVQESPDDTLEVAERIADIVATDSHRGFGDASFGPILLPRVQTKWAFKVDCDEWPTEQLLERLGDMTAMADEQKVLGVWVPFRSWVDDSEWEEQHSHLRLFHARLQWPPMLHSRPMIDDAIQGLTWQEYGCIEHRRSLDEMIKDYLVYYRIGKGNKGWDAHNKLMLRSACMGTAERRGWDHVKAYPWWPEVVEVAFDGKEPGMPEVKNTIYIAGTAGSGTRMVYDMASKLMAGTNKQVIHAAMPGYRYGEIENPVEHPVWWDREWMEERFGEGTWVIVRRDPYHAALSAVGRKFIAKPEEYEAYAAKGNEVLDAIAPEALVMQYEEIVANPQVEMDKLAGWLQRPSKWPGVIFDGNAKHPPKPEPKPEPEVVTEEIAPKEPAPKRRTRRTTKKKAEA